MVTSDDKTAGKKQAPNPQGLQLSQPSMGPMDPGKGRTRWSWNTMEGAFGLLSVLLVVIAVVAQVVEQSALSQVSAGVTVFLMSGFWSWRISHHYSKRQWLEETGKLALVSARHLSQLSAHMRAVSSEMVGAASGSESETDRLLLETKGAELDRMADAAELSYLNIAKMADLPLSSGQVASEVRQVLGAKSEKLTCPYCQSPEDVVLGVDPGRTKAIRCSSCGRDWVAHRLADGNVKVGVEESRRFECPQCRHHMSLRKKPRDFGVQLRTCLECAAIVSYDLGEAKVTGSRPGTRIVMGTTKSVPGQVSCPTCQYALNMMGMSNSKGETVQFCPRCFSLLVWEPLHGAAPKAP